MIRRSDLIQFRSRRHAVILQGSAFQPLVTWDPVARIRKSHMASEAPLEFRPPGLLRAILGIVGVMTAAAAILLTARSVSRHETAGIASAALLLVPTLIAVTLAARVYILTDSELSLRLPGVQARIPYSGIQWVDDARGSIGVKATGRHLNIALLSSAQREELLHALVERARLIRSMDPPFGVRARYIPRAEDIRFMPHHARRPTSEDSNDVVS